MAHKVKLTNPHGAVIIWNYADRINADGGQDVHAIEQVIINSASLISMSTQKRKSAPAGTFEFRLAPTFNWVARLTPGSWCVLLMSQDKPVPQITPDNIGVADKDLVKMLGRIDSVRLAMEVDQDTGARQTVFVVTGQDWCSVFDTKLYIDPIVRNNNFDKLSALGHAARLALDNFILEWTDSKHAALPTSTQVVDAMIQLWGAPLLDVEDAFQGTTSLGANPIKPDNNIIFSSEAQFKLPVEVAKYLQLGGIGGLAAGGSINFAKVIKRFDGILSDYDTYGGDNQESYGFPDPASMYKVNTFWQILTDNCNPVINELISDMRWEDTGACHLALYKRVKPFVNRATFDGSTEDEVIKNTSKFSNVRQIAIPLEDVININAGTNWRDKYNFIELRPQPQLNQTNFDTQVKVDSQIIDKPAYEREGFKPLIQSVYYMPFDGDEPAPLLALKWKYLLKEWFFNTHLMLNGSMTIVGQNQYIQVGDNILVDAAVLGPVSFNSLQDGNKAYFLAHVESVSHNFSVTSEGGRSFSTTIQFVRGVITKQDGTIFGSAGSGISGTSFFSLPSIGSNDKLDGALDRDAQDLKTASEKNPKVLATSTVTDPDKNKLKGT